MFRRTLLFTLCLLAGCSSPKAGIAGSDASDEVVAQEISTAVAGTYVKKRLKISRNGQRDAYVLLVLAGDTGSKAAAHPTVLMTAPYDGFDWSQDAVDQRWSSNASAAAGFTGDDVDSTNYPGTGGVPYALKSETDLYGDALYYLLHGVNVAFVFNRFYAGQTLVEHSQDTALALRYLAKLPNVDPERIGVYGLSWGGMTAAFGTIMSGVKVKQLTLLSPVLDVPALEDHFVNWVPLSVTSSAQRTAFKNFYAPYGRRIAPITQTSRAQEEAVASLWDPARLATALAQSSDDTLVIADDWDTLVTTSKTRNVVSKMPAAKVKGLWWSHPEPVNYETAALGHNVHPTHPLVYSNVMTIMQMHMAYALLPESQNMTVLIYDMNAWNFYLQYMRDEQLRGQDMTALTRTLIEMAGPRVTVQNQQNVAETAAGAVFVSVWLQLYWGVNIPANQVLLSLETSGLPD